MNKVLIDSCGQLRRCLAKSVVRLVFSSALVVLAAGQAFAQYGGGGGTGGGGSTGSGGTYMAPKGGYSSATGAGIGAGAVAGVGALFLALHDHGRLTGCVHPSDDGLRLLHEKNNKSYTLVPGEVYLTPGQRVPLKGQTSKDDGGTQTFTAKKLVKDLGSCGASPSPAASSNSPRSGSWRFRRSVVHRGCGEARS